jgi:hypothetical protein
MLLPMADPPNCVSLLGIEERPRRNSWLLTRRISRSGLKGTLTHKGVKIEKKKN